MSIEHTIRLVKAQAIADASDEIRVIIGFAKTPVRELTKEEGDTYVNHPLSSVMHTDDLGIIADWLDDLAGELSADPAVLVPAQEDNK
jgi:hypothetical protein